jgi:hypothetical protein
MKGPILLCIASLCSSISAIQLVERSNVNIHLSENIIQTANSCQPRVFSLDITRKDRIYSAPVRDRLRKRGTVSVTLDNLATLYFANVTMGTPGQSLRLDIDTGSSDIWANSATSTLCAQYASQCAVSGTFNANKSSSYNYVNSFFSITYADNSYAQGDYATDTLSLGGSSINNVPFGIGYRSTSAQGILGVGYATNVALVGVTGQTYQNLPLVMVAAKLINSPAYSLWLNDLDANTGSVLFGGVDTEKFNGMLSTVPVIQEQGQYREFIIGLTGLSVAGQTVINTAIPVLLDSGSSLSYLPTNYAQAVFKIFSASYSSQAGAAIVDCSYMNSQQTMTFTFSGITITVPMNEMVLIDGVSRGKQVCILGKQAHIAVPCGNTNQLKGISDSQGSTSVLGDTFLRSAYVVYDIANNQISLANTNFNATNSNVKEIASGANGVPSATGVSGAVSTLAVTTGAARGPQPTGKLSGAGNIKPAVIGVVGAFAAAVAGAVL